MNDRFGVTNRSSFGNTTSMLLFVLALVVLIAFLWFVPELQGKYFSQDVARKDVPSLVNEYRRTWAQILGGFGLLLGLYFTWRRVEIFEKTLETQKDQQVTERFTRAIDQLGATDDNGDPRLEIRLGGIYALERIAHDSPKRDYSTVIEILTAYVRANAPCSPEETSNSDISPNEQEEPSADIQAVLNVIRRRKENRVPEVSRVHIDLRRTNLAGTNLEEADFRDADFRAPISTGPTLEEPISKELTLTTQISGDLMPQKLISKEPTLQKLTLQEPILEMPI